MVLEGWSLIDVQLKLRYDIITRLVQSIKAYTKHESDIFRGVTALRTRAMQSDTPKEKEIAENVLTESVAHMMLVFENYPELKANEQFVTLQNQMMEIEEKIQKARRYYNGSVRKYNIATESFPANLVAALFRFERYDFFELDSIQERKSFELSFSSK